MVKITKKPQKFPLQDNQITKKHPFWQKLTQKINFSKKIIQDNLNLLKTNSRIIK